MVPGLTLSPAPAEAATAWTVWSPSRVPAGSGRRLCTAWLPSARQSIPTRPGRSSPPWKRITARPRPKGRSKPACQHAAEIDQPFISDGVCFADPLYEYGLLLDARRAKSVHRCSLPRRKCRNHVEFDAGAGRGELIDADRRARGRPRSEIFLEHGDHAVLVADICQVFRHLDHIGPGQPLVLQNGLDRLHRPAGLIFDPARMIVFGDHMGVLVIERRWRCA